MHHQTRGYKNATNKIENFRVKISYGYDCQNFVQDFNLTEDFQKCKKIIKKQA